MTETTSTAVTTLPTPDDVGKEIFVNADNLTQWLAYAQGMVQAGDADETLSALVQAEQIAAAIQEQAAVAFHALKAMAEAARVAVEQRDVLAKQRDAAVSTLNALQEDIEEIAEEIAFDKHQEFLYEELTGIVEEEIAAREGLNADRVLDVIERLELMGKDNDAAYLREVWSDVALTRVQLSPREAELRAYLEEAEQILECSDPDYGDAEEDADAGEAA